MPLSIPNPVEFFMIQSPRSSCVRLCRQQRFLTRSARGSSIWFDASSAACSIYPDIDPRSSDYAHQFKTVEPNALLLGLLGVTSPLVHEG